VVAEEEPVSWEQSRQSTTHFSETITRPLNHEARLSHGAALSEWNAALLAMSRSGEITTFWRGQNRHCKALSLSNTFSSRRGVSRISLHFDAHRFFFSSTLKTAPKKLSANSAPMKTSVHSRPQHRMTEKKKKMKKKTDQETLAFYP